MRWLISLLCRVVEGGGGCWVEEAVLGESRMVGMGNACNLGDNFELEKASFIVWFYLYH